ncbi:MAG: transposase [Pyrinomonadaceae bacterium]|nr:transposase [Acidobacteriota bacterium]MBK7933475.1 transposase [Acidobacteriota bacterium]MBP7375613.1 transposase [Pyrinomonadaceae bacterium]
MYKWRKLTKAQQERILRDRKFHYLPWHRPPHLDFIGSFTFIITAACFEHRQMIGKSVERIADFESQLLDACAAVGAKVYAWCVLPNHYHLLARTDRIKELRKLLGQLHGRTSRTWNQEDGEVGRKVWCNYFDREMKSDRHYWASLNYINNNAVQHEYVEHWQEWPYSSAHIYLEEFGREEAARIWRDYPVLDYGKGWDVY